MRVMGYRVLRFWVSAIDENIEGVVEAITGVLTQRSDGQPPRKEPPTNLPPVGGRNS